MVKLNLLIRNELMKLFSKKSTLCFFISLLLIVIMAVLLNNTMEPKYDEQSWKDQAKSELSMHKKELKEIDPEYKHFVEEDIKKLEFYLKHDINPYEKSSWSFVSFAIGITAFITLFAVIISSGIMANEYSGGTIKLLLTRPRSRIQILLSKYLAVIIVTVMMIIEVCLLSYVVGGITYGFGSFDSKLITFNQKGEAFSQFYIIFLFKKILFEFITMLVIITISFMISTIINNSAFAITTGIVTMFSIGTLTSLFSKYQWGKYLLFPNMDLKQYLSNSSGSLPGMTLPFSITINFIYILLFLVLTWVIFRRKEIKF